MDTIYAEEDPAFMGPDFTPGNDYVNAVDGEQDEVSCDGGTDTVDADALDTVAPDCVTVNIVAQ
jgi:hypothetical protein